MGGNFKLQCGDVVLQQVPPSSCAIRGNQGSGCCDRALTPVWLFFVWAEGGTQLPKGFPLHAGAIPEQLGAGISP